MKIALVVPGGVDRSGTDRVIPCILWLIEALVAAGHDIHVFALHQEPEPGEWALLGARVHNIGRRPFRRRTIAAILREHMRGRFDAIHSFWAQNCGVAGGIAAAVARVPHLLTLPGGDLTDLPDIGYGGWQRRRDRLLARVAVRLSSVVTAPSDDLCRRAKTLGFPVVHVPLGVAQARWPARVPQRRDPDRPIHLLHVASLNRVKDQETLLLAARALHDRGVRFELTIIGEDTLDGIVQSRAEALGIGASVGFVGYLPHHAMRPWFELADLLVMTSRHEAGPLVLLEAAVAGVPTVGTRVGHIADFAPDAAVAVAVGDWMALADAVVDLAADEASRLAIANRAHVRACPLTATATATTFASFYQHDQRTIAPVAKPFISRQ